MTPWAFVSWQWQSITSGVSKTFLQLHLSVPTWFYLLVVGVPRRVMRLSQYDAVPIHPCRGALRRVRRRRIPTVKYNSLRLARAPANMANYFDYWGPLSASSKYTIATSSLLSLHERSVLSVTDDAGMFTLPSLYHQNSKVTTDNSIRNVRRHCKLCYLGPAV